LCRPKPERKKRNFPEAEGKKRKKSASVETQGVEEKEGPDEVRTGSSNSPAREVREKTLPPNTTTKKEGILTKK